MYTVVISKTNVREMSGIGKVSKNPYHMAFQEAYIYTICTDDKENEFPEKFELILDKDKFTGEFIVHPVGRYLMHRSSLVVGRDGLEIKPHLVPMKAGASVAKTTP